MLETLTKKINKSFLFSEFSYNIRKDGFCKKSIILFASLQELRPEHELRLLQDYGDKYFRDVETINATEINCYFGLVLI